MLRRAATVVLALLVAQAGYAGLFDNREQKAARLLLASFSATGFPAANCRFLSPTMWVSSQYSTIRFRAGTATTQFVEQHFQGWKPPGGRIPAAALIAAALIEFQVPTPTAPSPDDEDLYSPWNRWDGFRLGGGDR